MNSIDSVRKKEDNEEGYQYEISSLLAWLQCLDWMNNVAYKLSLKKYNARLTN